MPSSKTSGNGTSGNGNRSNGKRRRVRQLKERPVRPDPRLPIKGRLLIVGGREDKIGGKVILRSLAQLVGNGKLVVATLASEKPGEQWAEYEGALRGLGVRHVYHLRIESRADAESPKAIGVLEGATAIFFTGGDQLRLTSLIGDTPVFSRCYEIYANGGAIAGTSAGASAMSETMLVANNGEASYRIKSALLMAPGLGLAQDMLIDQHFSERGRMARLIGAVSQNPRVLGTGIDEDTAIVVEHNRSFRVLGEGAVYVVDGSKMSYSNIGEEDSDRTLSSFGIAVHMLSQGDQFDLITRTPYAHPADSMEEEKEEKKTG